MTDLYSDEYDWRRRLSHTNMTGGGGFVAAAPVTSLCQTFNPPGPGGNLRSKNNIYSKEEEQEEPKSLPPDAFPGLQICQNCFCGRGSAPDPTGGDLALPTP